MSQQYADPRQPLPDPQQETLVQRIRQQVEAHPNLVALFVAAVGVGLALWWYSAHGGSIGGSSTGTTGTTGTSTDTPSGTGGTTAGTGTTDTSALQSALTSLQNAFTTLQNQFSALQNAVVTNAANGGSGGNGNGTLPTKAPTQPANPIVTGGTVSIGGPTTPTGAGNVPVGITGGVGIQAPGGGSPRPPLLTTVGVSTPLPGPTPSSGGGSPVHSGGGSPVHNEAVSIKSHPTVTYNQPDTLPRTLTGGRVPPKE